jgi:N-acetylneuraminic acid mutarotase
LETKTIKNRLQRRHNKLAVAALLAFTALVLALALTPSAQAGIWTTTGSLQTARGGPVILLGNGKVLAVGGWGNDSTTLHSAELYDPATQLWTPTGFMAEARNEFALTRLLNGKILAVGGSYYAGENNYITLNTAELYDPATGLWSPAGFLAQSRMMHAAALLPDGKVLVAGGSYNSGDKNYVTLSSAEIYDPDTGTWSNTDSLKTARRLSSIIRLPNGKFLAAGGGGSSGFLSSAELYDPDTGLWSYTGSLNTARSVESPILLPNGKVLVAGGWAGEWIGSEFISYPLSSAELYDPATGLWSNTGSLATARQEQPATLLPNGKVLTFGGYGASEEIILNSAELYEPATGLWRTTGSLNTARVGGNLAILLPNGKVLAAGGRGSSGTSGLLASAELYTPGEALPGINLLLLD